MTDCLNFIAEVAISIEVDDFDVHRYLEGNLSQEEQKDMVRVTLFNQEWGELMVNSVRVVEP